MRPAVQVLKHRIAQKHIENDTLISHNLHADRGTGFLIEALQTSLNKEEYTTVLNTMTMRRNYLVKMYNAGQRTCKKSSAASSGGGNSGGGGGDKHDALKALRRKQVEESIIRAKAEQILSLPNPEEGPPAPPAPADSQRQHVMAKGVERLRLKHAQKQAQGRTSERELLVPEENAMSYMQALSEEQRLEMLSLPAERLEAEVGRLMEQASHGAGPDVRGVKSAIACWLAILRGEYPEDSFVGRSLSGGFRVYPSVQMFNAVMHYCPLWRFYVRVFKSDSFHRPACPLLGPDEACVDANLWQLTEAAIEAVGPSVEAPALAPWARPPYCSYEDEPCTGSRTMEGMRKFAARWTKTCKSGVRESARKRLLLGLQSQGCAVTASEAQDIERLVSMCDDEAALVAVCLSVYRNQVCDRLAELEVRLLESSPLLFDMERSLGSVMNSVKETHHIKSLLLSMIADEDDIPLKELLNAVRVADLFDWIPEVLSKFKNAGRSEHSLVTNGCSGSSCADANTPSESLEFSSPVKVVVNVDGVPRVRSQRKNMEVIQAVFAPEGENEHGEQEASNNAAMHLAQSQNQYLVYNAESASLDFSFMIPPACSVEEMWRMMSYDPFIDQAREPRNGATGAHGLGGRSFSELCFMFANLEHNCREKYFHFTMDVLQKALDYANIHQTLGKLDAVARAAGDVRSEVEFEVTRSLHGVCGVRREWLLAAHKLLEQMLAYAQALTQVNFSLQHDFLYKRFCEGFEMDFQHMASKGQELQEVVQQIKSQAKQLETALQDIEDAKERFQETQRRHQPEAAVLPADGWTDLGCDTLAPEEAQQGRKKAELTVLGIKELQDGVAQCALGWRAHHDGHLGLRAEVLSFLRDRDDERLNVFCGCNRISIDMVKYLSLAMIREEFLRKAKLSSDESQRRLMEIKAQTMQKQLEQEMAEQQAIEQARLEKLALKKKEKLEKRRLEDLERRRREEEEAEELRQRQQKALMEKEMRRRQAEEERQQQRQRELEAAEAEARRRRDELESQELAAELQRFLMGGSTASAAPAATEPAQDAPTPAACQFEGAACLERGIHDSPSPTTPPNESLYFEDGLNTELYEDGDPVVVEEGAGGEDATPCLAESPPPAVKVQASDSLASTEPVSLPPTPPVAAELPPSAQPPSSALRPASTSPQASAAPHS